MRLVSVVTLLAARLAYTLALPEDLATADTDIASLIKTNRATQVAAGSKLAGKEALIQAYQKYNWTLPTPVEKRYALSAVDASATQTGTVIATDLPNDKAYYVHVKVGAQTLLLNMDSGSSDLWGFSTAMPTSQRGSHSLYQLGGKQAAGETWSISYAEGSSMLQSVTCNHYTLSLTGLQARQV